MHGYADSSQNTPGSFGQFSLDTGDLGLPSLRQVTLTCWVSVFPSSLPPEGQTQSPKKCTQMLSEQQGHFMRLGTQNMLEKMSAAVDRSPKVCK